MDLQFITTIALPICLVLIMFGLGLTLTLFDFKRVLLFPKPILIGLFCQMILLPIFALALCYLFRLQPEFAIGLIILAASPGGVTSNIFSHLSDGDVALNMTLTAINSVLSALSLPLLTGLAIYLFGDGNQNVQMQFRKVVEVFSVVLVPASLGLLLHAKKPDLAKKFEKILKIFSVLVLVLIILVAVVKEWELLTSHLHEIGIAILLFNLGSLALGYWVPQFFKIPQKQATSISLEIGIHNGTLALYMAISVLGSTKYAVPAAIYSVLMYFTAAGFAYLLNKRNKSRAL